MGPGQNPRAWTAHQARALRLFFNRLGSNWPEFSAVTIEPPGISLPRRPAHGGPRRTV